MPQASEGLPRKPASWRTKPRNNLGDADVSGCWENQGVNHTGNWNRILADTLSTQRIAEDMHRSLTSINASAFDSVRSATDDLLRHNASTLSNIKMAAAVVDVPAITDTLAAVRSYDFGAWNIAAQVRAAGHAMAMQPLIDQQVALASAMPTAAALANWDQITASLRSDFAHTASWAAQADLLASIQGSLGAIQLPRLSLVASSFLDDTGSSADALGKLYRGIHENSRLGQAVDEAIAATQQRGAFGFNQSGVAERVLEVERILEDDPEVAHRLAPLLEEAQEATGIDDELMVSFDEVIGLYQGIRQHEFSSVAAIISLTVGLSAFMAGVAVAPGETVPQVVASLLTGGATYAKVAAFVNRHKPRD